jgi:putative ABC transport system permease protein
LVFKFIVPFYNIPLAGFIKIDFDGCFLTRLGLLGLTRFSAELRTKEIGIRKVLGVGSVYLFTLLAREFLLLVGMVFIISTPIGRWSMHYWLQQFAYQVLIRGWIFGASEALVLLIRLATVAGQPIKTASANPVKSLGTE